MVAEWHPLAVAAAGVWLRVISVWHAPALATRVDEYLAVDTEDPADSSGMSQRHAGAQIAPPRGLTPGKPLAHTDIADTTFHRAS